MDTNLRDLYPKEYIKIKNLGYDTIDRRKLEPNKNTGFHTHPFTACMIILEGKVLLNNVSEEIVLKKGDFISVDNNISHNEKIGPKGAVVLYGKKLDENKQNIAIIEDSLNGLYLETNNQFISFITITPASYILYLTLYKQHYSEIWINQEDIFKLIPRKYASRSTIINLINNGINRKYIKKARTYLDKRAVYYELSDDIFYEIESWIKVRKSKLVNILRDT